MRLKTASVLHGDYSLLEHASDVADGIQQLCAWWNCNAPEGMRHAEAFHLYEFSHENTEYLFPFDYPEPLLLIESMIRFSNYAIFEAEGKPIVVALFLRGRSAYKVRGDIGDDISTYLADGGLFWELTGDPDWDHAQLSSEALRRFKEGDFPGPTHDR